MRNVGGAATWGTRAGCNQPGVARRPGASGGSGLRSSEQSVGTSMDVRDVGVALWRQRPLVVLILVITGVAVAAGILLARKSSAETATISAAEAPGVARTDDPDALRATLAGLANSRGVVDLVRDRIATDRSVAALRRSIQGDWVRGTILVTITVQDRDPDAAAAIANAVSDLLVRGAVVDRLAGPSLTRSLVLTSSDPARPP